MITITKIEKNDEERVAKEIFEALEKIYPFYFEVRVKQALLNEEDKQSKLWLKRRWRKNND